MSKENIVCPNCGCGVFTAERLMSQKVVVWGNGNSYGQPIETRIVSESNYTCTDCNKTYRKQDLVTESHFHNVICTEDKADEQ